VTRRVEVLANSGPGVGLGHVVRCLAVADELCRQGAVVTFRTPGDPRAEAMVAAREVEAAPWGAPPEGSTTVLDGYALASNLVATTRARSRRLLWMDDLQDPVPDADLVVNPAAGTTPATYPDLPADRLLLGPRFACVRPEVVAARAAAGPAPDGDGVRGLFLLGGATRPGAAEAVTALAAALVEDGTLARATVLGGAPGDGPSDPRVEVLAFHPRPWEAMVGAQVAVSAGGQTLYELACLGVAVVGYQLTMDQAPNLAGLADEGALVLVGEVAAPGFSQTAGEAVRGLVADAARREAMAARGAALIDGQGASRVAAALLEGEPK
jgi:spore coat polysaccharide biosynthesis predicted glycosyltransferase SpsG